MKRLGFFALLIAFFAPLALNAAFLNTVKYLPGSELLESGVVAAGRGVNLASPSRTNHILFGDGPGSGGHMWPGQAGKSVFPKDWSGDKIMNAISDIATDPSLKWLPQTGNGGLFTKAGNPARFLVEGMRDGVNIRVILEPAGEGIITAFPF